VTRPRTWTDDQLRRAGAARRRVPDPEGPLALVAVALLGGLG
jgi:hypothetical protein